MSYIDITGQRFGKLVAIKKVEPHITPNGNKITQWFCQCDCGNTTIVRSASLRNGITKSCGCYKKEYQKTLYKKYCTYDLSGEYGIGITNQNYKFLFDKDKYDKIKDYCWAFDNSKRYYVARINGENVLLHRFLLDLKPGDNKIVDHINGDCNDNRLLNLRIVTALENAHNTARKPSISGVVGVRWNKEKNKWDTSIYYNNTEHFLGYYINLSDAIKVRKDAEDKYYGEYSRDNSLKLFNERVCNEVAV